MVADGDEATTTKRTINTQRIHPPLIGDRNEILAAAVPVVVVQTRPTQGSDQSH